MGKPWRTALAVLLVACASAGGALAEPAETFKADKVLVIKRERKLFLLRRGQVLKTYRISLGRDPVGHKVREGDGRTPEGTYLINRRNPESYFYRSLHISYPDAEDLEQADATGISPGGAIAIHGWPTNYARIGADYFLRDWTEGCIAVNNDDMAEMWTLVDEGTEIEILPGILAYLARDHASARRELFALATYPFTLR